MLMSDDDIRAAVHIGWIEINPFDRDMLQPASIDVRLGNTFIEYINNDRMRDGELITIDPEEDTSRLHQTSVVPNGGTILLHPGAFMLAHTLEIITLGDKHAARLEGRSSFGRLGLIVHSTAGFIDPGFTGQITLELSNLAPHPLLLRPGMRVAQVSFTPMISAARAPYGMREGSKYQGQKGATPSLAYRDKW
jgi:dCTP deaminase